MLNWNTRTYDSKADLKTQATVPRTNGEPICFEPLESRLLLSGTLSAQFVSVDNSAALTGYNTFDLQVNTSDDWTGTSMLIELTQGSIYQDPNAVEHHQMDPSLFPGVPALEFDTYLKSKDSIANIAGNAAGFGGGALQFDSSKLNVTWYSTDRTVGADTGIFNIARLTFSDDAAGTWKFSIINRANEMVTQEGVLTAGTLPAAPIPVPAAINDFDGDGNADVFWRNSKTGHNQIWHLVDGEYASSTRVRRLSDTNWKYVGTGDFTGDGKSDVLWRHAKTGRNTVWEMDGGTIVQGHRLRARGNPKWQIVGVGDFNDDGSQDILWRHSKTGKNSIWEMNGLTFAGRTDLRTVGNQDWKIAGVADMNNDRHDDILWQHQPSGKLVVWEMVNSIFNGRNILNEARDPNWMIGGLADFDGNGAIDILWRNTQNGIINYRFLGHGDIQKALELDYVFYKRTNQDWQPGDSLAFKGY